MLLGFSRWPSERMIGASSQTRRLLFLHGMGGTGALWRPIAASIENDFDILAPDQRGHGRSQIAAPSVGRTPAQYTPLDSGYDILDTMQHNDFHPAVLIGHSMGVRSACAVAHLKPEWVQGLILIDLGFYGPAGGGLGEGLAHFLKILPVHFKSREEARQFMNENCPDPSIAQYLMAVSVPNPQGGIDFPFDHGALIQTIQAARDISIREWITDLGKRKMPILVLRGAKSLVWSQEEYEKEREFFSAYPSIVFEEFADAGHGLPFEKRLQFVARLRQFLNEIQGQAQTEKSNI